MSLRRRFVILALLATVAIGAAVASIAQLFTRSDTAREQAGHDTTDAMVSALDRGLSSRSAGPQLDEAVLRTVAASVAGPQIDAHAGFCGADILVAAASPGPRREPRHPELPPDQRDVVRAACGNATSRDVFHQRLPHSHDVVLVSARQIAPALTAWALVRVPTHPEEGPQVPFGSA